MNGRKSRPFCIVHEGWKTVIFSLFLYRRNNYKMSALPPYIVEYEAVNSRFIV